MELGIVPEKLVLPRSRFFNRLSAEKFGKMPDISILLLRSTVLNFFFFLECAGDLRIIALRGGKSFQYINAHQAR
jgi:hypothetical protein